MRFSLTLVLLFALTLIATSCLYRSPYEDEIVVKPRTNNPLHTGDSGQKALAPNAKF